MTKNWLESRRLFLQRIKEQVRLLSGAPDDELLSYEKNLSSLYKKTWDQVEKNSFLSEVDKVKYILCGDFHSSPGAQKFHSKWISEYALNHPDEKIVIALECFSQDHQNYFNAWISGSISDDTFLEKVNWEYQWGFNFESYKALIKNLLAPNVRFLCVNSNKEKLYERDESISSFIFKNTDNEEKVFVIIGQYHLAKEHLPSFFETDSEVLSIHLNSEELYFAIADLHLENEVEVLKYENHYCFLHTPPWIQWQDHLFYLEEQYEEDQFLSGDDFNSVVFDYVSLIKKDLNIETSHEMFGVSFVDELMDDDFEREWGELILPMVESETSFYWPEKEEGVLVVPSFNHAATVAGRFVHAELMGLKSLPFENNLQVCTWLEASGYFLSKLINPKRRPRSIKSMTAYLNSRMSGEEAKSFINKLIRNRVGELDGLKPEDFKNWSDTINASRLKGSLIGETLFNLYASGKLSVETLKSYLSMPLYPSEKFDSFYNFLIARLESED